MAIQTGLIWGDDAATTTFAKSFTDELCLIFKFSLDAQVPHGLPSRIAACYHGSLVPDESSSFTDRQSMRKNLYSLIEEVWPQCMTHPSIRLQDVVVDIYQDLSEQIQWRVSHEGSFRCYIEALLPLGTQFISGTDIDPIKENIQDYIPYSTLLPIHILGGRGDTSLVRISSEPGSLYVFKGVHFGLFLESPAEFCHERDTFYHEFRTVSSMPRHPNVVSPPKTLVLASKVEDEQQMFVCGTLYPYMSNGSLDQIVEKCETTKTRLPLKEKAKWCHQMALALCHTHFQASTYHMDVKLSNFLVDDNRDLVLIDWEQSGASPSNLAPEADGSWDVERGETSCPSDESCGPTNPMLLYRKYQGPPRENLWSWPKWNVFPIWRDASPKALELAEVFSLGMTMGMLLQQRIEDKDIEDKDIEDKDIEDKDIEDKDIEDKAIRWPDSACDIPQSWKAIVSRCVEVDPNKRVGLAQLVTFWEQARDEH